MIQVKEGDNWLCPFCGHHQAVTRQRVDTSIEKIQSDDSAVGPTALILNSIVCANQDCKQLTLAIELRRGARKYIGNSAEWQFRGQLGEWRLLPESCAKPIPEFVPNPLRQDYREACLIRNGSPKASATLSRRCLQGMIRDFCGIAKPTLAQEINELEERVQAGNAPAGVQPDNIDAINHVRSIGNIGAHMEKDINVVIEVEPEEADQLIWLTELLFDEWYVARHNRAERLAALKRTAEQKNAAKKGGP